MVDICLSVMISLRLPCKVGLSSKFPSVYLYRSLLLSWNFSFSLFIKLTSSFSLLLMDYLLKSFVYGLLGFIFRSILSLLWIGVKSFASKFASSFRYLRILYSYLTLIAARVSPNFMSECFLASFALTAVFFSLITALSFDLVAPSVCHDINFLPLLYFVFKFR